MEDDPNEFTNLANRPEHAAIIAELDQHLDARLQSAGLAVKSR
jgi:hypothetical protein